MFATGLADTEIGDLLVVLYSAAWQKAEEYMAMKILQEKVEEQEK